MFPTWKVRNIHPCWVLEKGGIMATICLSKKGIYMVIIGFNVKWSDNSICCQPMDNVWYVNWSQGFKTWVCFINKNRFGAWQAINIACKTFGHQNYQCCMKCKTKRVEGSRWVVSIDNEGITTKVKEITRENSHMEPLMLWLAHSLNKCLQVWEVEVNCSCIEDWEVILQKLVLGIYSRTFMWVDGLFTTICLERCKLFIDKASKLIEAIIPICGCDLWSC